MGHILVFPEWQLDSLVVGSDLLMSKLGVEEVEISEAIGLALVHVVFEFIQPGGNGQWYHHTEKNTATDSVPYGLHMARIKFTVISPRSKLILGRFTSIVLRAALVIFASVLSGVVIDTS